MSVKTEIESQAETTADTGAADVARKLKAQNRWLLNLAWWMGLVFLGEAYVFSPFPGALASSFVDEGSIFWPIFWSMYVIFLLAQSVFHRKVLNKYFPEWRGTNIRFVIGVPAVAAVLLVSLFFLLVPGTHL
jgi:hypothetical protein